MYSLTTYQLVVVMLLSTTCNVRVSADSFQAQFSNTVYYGLAIAGVSMGAAMGAALLALLIYCLIRRQREKDNKLTRSDTEASNSTNSRGGGVNFGPMALPGVAKPIDPARNGSKLQPTAEIVNGVGVRTGGGGGGGGSGGADSGGRKRAPAVASNVHYTNPAFSSNSLDSGAVVGSNTSLFRHSSLLRPMPYTASVESNPSRGNGGPAAASVIQHPNVRTSPASTLDPRTFLSQDGLGQRQLPAPSSGRIAGVTDYSKRFSYSEQPQHQQLKRFSYAEQRAQTSSSVELVSGQVFASTSSPYSTRVSGQDRSLTRQPASMVRVLPTQLEEEFMARKKQPAPKPPQPAPKPPQPAPKPPQAAPLEEGPSFPKTATRSMSFAKQQQQQPQQREQQQRVEEDPVSHRQSLHRINLGGGEDGRSVTSTVLKQEAMEAFEFLDTLE